MKKFLAGVARAILLRGNTIIGVANTLITSGFDFTIASEEIRGGQGNGLFGKYFHDSALNVTIEDAMFNLEYVAASLGTTLRQGGLSFKEEEATVATAKQIPLSTTPLALEGSLVAWYSKPGQDNWITGTVKNANGKYYIDVEAATVGEKYCIKYFWQNENAESIVIPVQYVPAELHVILINDEFSGEAIDSIDTTAIGRLITDIPRLQLAGEQNLALSATGAATTSLSGSALAVASDATSCETDAYYGTMTEEIFGATWQDNVVALAIEDNDIQLATSKTATLSVYAVYGGNKASQKKDNSNFTFTVVGGSSSIITVDATGLVTAKGNGSAYVQVTLTGKDNVAPAYAQVTVA